MDLSWSNKVLLRVHSSPVIPRELEAARTEFGTKRKRKTIVWPTLLCTFWFGSCSYIDGYPAWISIFMLPGSSSNCLFITLLTWQIELMRG